MRRIMMLAWLLREIPTPEPSSCLFSSMAFLCSTILNLFTIIAGWGFALALLAMMVAAFVEMYRLAHAPTPGKSMFFVCVCVCLHAGLPSDGVSSFFALLLMYGAKCKMVL